MLEISINVSFLNPRWHSSGRRSRALFLLTLIVMDFTCKYILNDQFSRSAVSFQFWLIEIVQRSEKESQKRGSNLLTGCWSPTNRVLNTKPWGVVLISFKRIHPGIWAPSYSRWFLFLFAAKSRVAQCIQTLRWPMSTRGPWLESFCFPGYHLGFRKHSFMVAGLLPAGPMVINQGHKRYRPLRLSQTLCVGRVAGGLGLESCFLLIQSKKT